MSENKKLSDTELEVFRHVAAQHDGSSIQRLIAHIDAMEAENQRWGSKAAKDAYELGMATRKFIQQQTDRIAALENLLSNAAQALQPLANAEPLSELKCNRAAEVIAAIEAFRS